LQESAAELKRRGIGLAAISYDAPATLKAFADARGITFPLLADQGSATIKRYNLLNSEATGQAAGVPYPGTFVLNARGVVTSRSFEAAYQERTSAAGILALGTAPGSGGGTTETAHLFVAAGASDARVAPGTRLALYLDVTPKPKMHVYAPEQKDVIPVSVKLDAGEFRIHAPQFPRPETYFFKPLNETQLVYSKPFRIVQEITVALTPVARERARSAGSIVITGALTYQACDDAICYMPVTVPVTWTVGLKPLVSR
jgi:AhpC/TSA family/Disulphide bond corrector protein DsbC